jgi:phospholipid/cholesterol/gamma-HCH transport system substrate-binding protein
MSARRREAPRWVDVLLGLVYGLVVVALVGGAVLAYDRAFVPRSDVELRTDSVGNALQKGSDVKLHGVPVGEVSKITTAPDGAVLTLALEPDVLRRLAPDTTARLLPKTLFGERYVELQSTSASPGSHLQAGATIDQDASADAVELQRVLDELLPLLQSIQPEKLQATLNELATMLRGRGGELGDTLQAWGEYVEKLQPSVPTLAEDLDRLGTVAETYADAAPDLLTALDDLTTTSATLVDKGSALTEVYQRVIASADESRGWVASNANTIEVLSAESRKALEAAAPYARTFPCLLRSARQFVPRMDKALGKGTSRPGLKVVLNVSPPRSGYRPGRDTPRFGGGGKPSCPYVPTGAGARTASAAGDPDTIAPPAFDAQASAVASAGLDEANSPAENQLIAELVGPSQGMSPDDYPRWGSLLVGPTLRGTEVELR